MASTERIRVCIAGATGQVGRCLVPAVVAAEDLDLVSAVARSAAGRDLGEALGGKPLGLIVMADLAPALDVGVDVLIDYTHAAAVQDHVLTAIKKGVSVVVGSSGLREYQPEVATAAEVAGVGVVTGNFALTAALMQHLALIAARHLPSWEVLEYNQAAKPDMPSATASELAELLSAVHRPEPAVAESADGIGPREARGVDIDGTRVHSVRLPGYNGTCEVIFALPGERLIVRHDSIDPGEPFVSGSLFAAREIVKRTGLVQGLDALLFGRDTE